MHDDHFHCYDHGGAGAVAHTRSDTFLRGGAGSPDITFYSMKKDLTELANRSGGKATLSVLGTTPTARGGRDIMHLRIGAAAPGKPRVLFTGGMHAREWISPTYVYLIGEWLIDNYAANPIAKDIVDNHVLNLVPMCNPDGHEYSVTTNRMWRKNSPAGDPDFQTAPAAAAAGVQAGAPESVDLNRNFDTARRAAVLASGRGVWSNTLTDDSYVGSSAASSFEATTLQTLISNEQVDVMIDYHAFGCFALNSPGDDTRPLMVIDPHAGRRNSSFTTRMKALLDHQAGLNHTTRPGTADTWTVSQASLFYATLRGLAPADSLVPGSIKDFAFYAPTGRFIVATATSNLNVRSGPGLGHAVIDSLPRGTIVETTAASGGFRQLHTGGWVSSTFLRPARPLCFTLELPPMHYAGSPGFELPEGLIRTVFRMCLGTSLALIKHARQGAVSAADFFPFRAVP